MSRVSLLLVLCLAAGCRDGESITVQPEPTPSARPRPATAAEHAAIVRDVEASLAKSATPTVRTLPDGSMIATVPGDSTVVMARRGSDGRVETECVESAAGAEAFLAGGAAGEEQ
jgi:hypothetical protein